MSENVEEQQKACGLTQPQIEELSRHMIQDIDEEDRRLAEVRAVVGNVPPIPHPGRGPRGIDDVHIHISDGVVSVTLTDTETGEEFVGRDRLLWKAFSYACLVASRFGNRKIDVGSSCPTAHAVHAASYLARRSAELVLYVKGDQKRRPE